MEPQPQQPASINPTASPTAPPARRPHRWLMLATLLVVLAIAATAAILWLSKPPTKPAQPTSATLTVGNQPFIYPCAVATPVAYATAFGLSTNTQSYGSAQETSVLSPSQIPATKPPTTNLLQLLSLSSGATVTASCDLSGLASGATTPTNIRIDLFEDPTPAAAQSGYSNLLSVAQTDAVPPTHLTGLADANFLEPPDPTNNNQHIAITFLHHNTIVTLDYDLATSESPSTATGKLTNFAQSIGHNMDNAQLATTATDLTGTATFVGKPLVDLCRRTDLLGIAQALGSITYRLDHVIDQSIYGGGQSAGSISDCEVAFNTAADRQTNGPSQNPGANFNRKATFRVSTYKDVATARLALQNQQTIDRQGATFNSLSGLGQIAYTTTQTFNGPNGPTVTTTYRIQQDDHVVSIVFAQPDNSFTTAQVNATYRLIYAALTR